MPFPSERPRRLRRTEAMRRLVRETDIEPRNCIAPLFIKDGIDAPEPISSMPGHSQHTLESVVGEAKLLTAAGVGGLLLFGIPTHKDPRGQDAYSPEGIVQRALRTLKDALGDQIPLVADLCMCEYTDHGHCGVLRDGAVVNDETLELYARIAQVQAAAGADVIAPSGMMDGQVAAIRAALPDDVPIMAYAAKFASAMYGPFREAAECSPREGDRSAYQMDPANRREALREALLDEAEGADVLMVKPALAYLDVISDVRSNSDKPVAAYNVSGEYSMVKAAAANGWLDERRVALESLTAIRRAGADIVITYWAKDLWT